MSDPGEVSFGVKTLGVLFGIILVGIISLVSLPVFYFCGWCDAHLWNWFLVPYFHAPHISIWLAVALGLLIRLQTLDFTVLKEQPKIDGLKTLGATLTTHAFYLGVGYGIHHFFLP